MLKHAVGLEIQELEALPDVHFQSLARYKANQFAADHLNAAPCRFLADCVKDRLQRCFLKVEQIDRDLREALAGKREAQGLDKREASRGLPDERSDLPGREQIV